MSENSLTQPVATNQEPSTKKKIMFVDDDNFLLDMYTLKFSKANYDVKAVDSTDIALKLLNDGYTPDIILADVVMPGMDGLQFVERIRKNKLVPNAILIMLTNQGTSEDIGKAKNLNVNGYIVKATTIPSEVLKEVEKISEANKK